MGDDARGPEPAGRIHDPEPDPVPFTGPNDGERVAVEDKSGTVTIRCDHLSRPCCEAGLVQPLKVDL